MTASRSRLTRLVHFLGDSLAKTVTDRILLLEPALEIFFVDCDLGGWLSLVESGLALYLGQTLSRRATCNGLDLPLLLDVLLAHLGERFTLQAGALLLPVLQKLLLALLGLAALFVELGLALALLLALAAEELLTEDSDANERLLERFIIDVLGRRRIIRDGVQGRVSPATWLNIVLTVLDAGKIRICRLRLLHCVAERALQLLRRDQDGYDLRLQTEFVKTGEV